MLLLPLCFLCVVDQTIEFSVYFVEASWASSVMKRSDDFAIVIDSSEGTGQEGRETCYDDIASCTALIKAGGMDCSTSGAREFCRESCNVCVRNQPSQPSPKSLFSLKPFQA